MKVEQLKDIIVLLGQLRKHGGGFLINENGHEKLKHPFLYSYVKYFESLEFKRCESGEYEEGIEKIAIYYSSGVIFKHVAFRLDRDRWASKLGGWEDIYHKNVNCLAGGKYGIYIIYMKRELTWLRKLKRQVALSSTKILSMKS